MSFVPKSLPGLREFPWETLAKEDRAAAKEVVARLGSTAQQISGLRMFGIESSAKSSEIGLPDIKLDGSEKVREKGAQVLSFHASSVAR